MPNHGTASQLRVDGGYVEFQLAVLRALPRDIDLDVTDSWRNNGKALKKALRAALLPFELGLFMKQAQEESRELGIPVPKAPRASRK